jgi:hypothetical protein
VNFYMISEQVLSDRLQSLEDSVVAGYPASYHIWDISRFHRQHSSRGQKEALDIDFKELYGIGLSCLRANLGSDDYESYLVVISGEHLADLYGRYGARLLEQNVRSFLQARGKVNKGIRATIVSEPAMFFAYNNGITATAQDVKVVQTEKGLEISRVKDLQIVNGGQTTASLFHTRRRDKASLSSVAVQMKLSVIDSEKIERVVPRISEYANTQNRVNAADFFSNHPFHMRIEDISRRLYAPAQQGEQRETKWFYERARGQYADAQAKLTAGEQRRFKAEYPRSQMFTKTDLAKYENVWDAHPKWVNRGAQKNFAQFAGRIGLDWKTDPDGFNEYYFRRLIARAILFRTTEKLVSAQTWYSGGYRANIVAYTFALISNFCIERKLMFDFMKIWERQQVDHSTQEALKIAMKMVNDTLMMPRTNVVNISEWCKKDECWTVIKHHCINLEHFLPDEFLASLRRAGEEKDIVKEAKKLQKGDNRINAQVEVVKTPKHVWTKILAEGRRKTLLSEKEIGILEVAAHPARVPTEKQSQVLLQLFDLGVKEGIIPPP